MLPRSSKICRSGLKLRHDHEEQRQPEDEAEHDPQQQPEALPGRVRPLPAAVVLGDGGLGDVGQGPRGPPVVAAALIGRRPCLG